MLHKKFEKTPYDLWKGHICTYKQLKVRGCLAKMVVSGPKVIKIRPKTIDCVFTGYANNSSAYLFLVYNSKISDVHVNTITESRILYSLMIFFFT